MLRERVIVSRERGDWKEEREGGDEKSGGGFLAL